MFQATNFGLAVEEINRMLSRRKEEIPAELQQQCKDNGVKEREQYIGTDLLFDKCGSFRSSAAGLVEYNCADCLHDIPGLHLQHGELWGAGHASLSGAAQHGGLHRHIRRRSGGGLHQGSP